MSIRMRITLIVALTVVVVMAGVVVAVTGIERDTLEQALADSLQEHLDTAAELVAQGQYQRAIDDSGNVVIELFDSDGEAVGAYQPASLIYQPDEHADEDVRETVSSLDPEEGPFLVAQRDVTAPDGPITLVGVMSLDEVVAAQKVTADTMVAVLAIVLVFVIVLTWALVGMTLKPVEDMRAQAEAVALGKSGNRIAEPRNERELAQLAATLNGMIDRIEQSYERQKQFASDASHELKSPLAATSVILEALKAHPEGVDLAAAVGELAHENARMTSIVDALLMLTRADEGRLEPHARPVDVMDVIFDEIAAISSYSQVRFDTRNVEPVVMRADVRLMGQAIRNVLDNASKFAKSLVAVSASEDNGTLVITVEDDGPGIPEEMRERVFDRFVSIGKLSDAANGAAGTDMKAPEPDAGTGFANEVLGYNAETADARMYRSSTGLGLPVARTVVELHHGTIAIGESPLGGARVSIRLPGSLR